VFNRVGAFFVNVEPPFAPSLDRIRKFDVEVIDISSDTDNNAAYVIGGVVGAIAAEAENAFPHRKNAINIKKWQKKLRKSI
jgi:hypothetical protein